MPKIVALLKECRTIFNLEKAQNDRDPLIEAVACNGTEFKCIQLTASSAEEWLGKKDIGFCLTQIAWNRGSRFCTTAVMAWTVGSWL
jgi:hypothetical protein